MKTNSIVKFVSIFGLTAAFSLTAAAQDVQTRSITSDDFAKARPTTVNSANAKKAGAVRINRRTYKFVRTVRRNPKAPRPIGRSNFTDIGVTIWRLRPPAVAESGMFLLPVLDDNKERKMWLAERVSTETTFEAGDRIRFAVESSASGYLYVFGRETYADGSLGAPYPVFAASRTGENMVRPGMLFDIPDQREDLPYLRMNPKQTNYTGELLTVIVSPKPLANLLVTEDGKMINGDDLAKLEFGTEVEIFTRTDVEDKFYSRVESESACGVKTRELQRESSATDPCGNKYRELTREQALPQSIYRVKGAAGQPAVALIKLSVRSAG